MAGSTKGFRVEPEALLKVANQVEQLLEELSGKAGYMPGNKEDYSKSAKSEELAKALQTFFDSPTKDAFASAYEREHTGIIETMDAMITQLTTLHTACVTTAQNYQNTDDSSKQDVTQAGKTGNWAAP